MKITKPTFLIDEVKCRKNILLMKEKSSRCDVDFRPHFKTHQSAEIGEWFRESGVSKITVSSVRMAEYFNLYGWNNILIAFPINILETDSINKLAEKNNLYLTLESVLSANYLNNNLNHRAGIYLKIDTGYHRTGLASNNFNEIDRILKIVDRSERLDFTGFLTHSGHTYDSASKQEITGKHHESIDQLINLKEKYSKQFSELIISIGDTPSCSIAEDFTGVDEIRPGNFVFYDVMQFQLGSCREEEIAVSLACPVVAKHKSRNEIVVYGGAVHLSKDSLLNEKGGYNYGRIVIISENGWQSSIENAYVSNISQEHGIIKLDDHLFNRINVGDIIGILPIHSCLTANLADVYQTLSGRKIARMR